MMFEDDVIFEFGGSDRSGKVSNDRFLITWSIKTWNISH